MLRGKPTHLTLVFGVGIAILPRMKIITAIVLTAALTTSCKTNRLPYEERGDLENGVYSNTTWGFTFRVPDQWTVTDAYEVEEVYKALIGRPAGIDPLFTCYCRDRHTSSLVMCLVQKDTTPENVLSYTLTSIHPDIIVGMHPMTIHGQAFSHLQLTETKAKKTYVIDMFATDIKGDAILILLSQEHAPLMADTAKFIGRHFARTR